jgi:charged multivesicular body protein 4
VNYKICLHFILKETAVCHFFYITNMSWLFGKKKQEPKVTPQTACEANAAKIEELQKKIEHLDKQADAQAKKAVQYMKAKNKKKALECMKMKKMYENQSTTITNMCYNLQQQQNQLQMAQISADAFGQYAQNTKAMRQALGGLDADKIDEMRDENEDVMDQLNEITDILAQPSMEGLDDAEDELAALMEADEEAGEEIPGETEKVRPSAEHADEDAEIGDLMAGFA